VGRRVRVWDVLGVVALAAFVVLQVVARVNQVSEARASDTFTHVDIVVDDDGVQVTPSEVPAGIVEVGVADKRAKGAGALTVRDEGEGVVFREGTNIHTLRVVRGYDLRAFSGRGEIEGVHGDMRVTVPALTAPREDANVVTVDVRAGGLSTPNRDARLEQPIAAESDAGGPAEHHPWTTIAPGEIDFVVRNETSGRVGCQIDGVTKLVFVDGQETLRATLDRDGARDTPGSYVLSCLDGDAIKRLGLWMAP
jgi:hypothetical protein